MLWLVSGPGDELCAETAAPEPDAAAPAAIQARLERDPATGPIVIAGSELASRVLLPSFYERRQFRPAWSDPADVEALLVALRGSESHGLDPADYHLAALEQLRPRAGSSPEESADFDLLLTDALIRLSYHLEYGKVDPSSFDADWNYSHELPEDDPVAALQGALESHRVREAIDARAPQGWMYERMRAQLADLRRVAAAGGWPRVPEGETLRPGDSDPRVAAMRARLVAAGDLTASAEPSEELFDESLAEALRRFQARHGLDPDGVAGARTLAELNVSAADRIDQLRVNLERARWVLHDVPERFVLVNVASYEVAYFADRKLLWRARAQIGKEARRTPIFRSEMKYLVLNPTWTVPPGILAKDILSAGANAGAVVQRKGLRVFDASGREVSPASLSWGRYSARNFPYTLRQDPGPKNALGRVKFMFPNPHLVYLHDTPSVENFERSERAFSSGCIRIEQPLELATQLLGSSGGWSRERIDSVIASGKTTTVWLPEPLPVLLLYWTALPTLEGELRFFRDLYRRDPKVLAGLQQSFAFRRAAREAVSARL